MNFLCFSHFISYILSVVFLTFFTLYFSPGLFQVDIEVDHGPPITLDVDPSDTINKVKAMLNEKLSIPQDQQCLIFDGREMDPGLTLEDYYLQPGDTISMIQTIVWF